MFSSAVVTSERRVTKDKDYFTKQTDSDSISSWSSNHCPSCYTRFSPYKKLLATTDILIAIKQQQWDRVNSILSSCSPPPLHDDILIKDEERTAGEYDRTVLTDARSSGDSCNRTPDHITHEDDQSPLTGMIINAQQPCREQPPPPPASLLHVACSIVPSIPGVIVKRILEVYGYLCCLVKDDNGNLPIHIACSTPGIDPMIIQLLLSLFPDTSYQRGGEDRDGEVPLYLLLQHHNDDKEKIFKLMLESLPAQCFIDPNKGTSLLHETCSSLLPNSILHQILCLYPEICSVQKRGVGDTIAHIICSHKNSTLPMIQTLYYHCGSNIFSTQDYDGHLPLHVINSEQHSEDIIQFLLTAFPQSIKARNNEMQTVFSAPHFRDSPTKIMALLKHSDRQVLSDVLKTPNKHGILLTTEVFYHLQQHLSVLCNNSQIETSPAFLRKLHLSNQLLKNQVNSLCHLMTELYYGHHNIQGEWPACSYDHESNLPFCHDLRFWQTFPLFSILLLHQYPGIAFQKDLNGDLLLDKIAHSQYTNNNVPTTLICSMCSQKIENGIFFSVGNNHDHICCTKCQSTKKRYLFVQNQTQLLPLLNCQVSEMRSIAEVGTSQSYTSHQRER